MAEEQIQSQPQGETITPAQENVGGESTPKGGEPQTKVEAPVKSPDELQADFLKSLGVNSIEDAQKAIKGFNDYQESQKTEQQKQEEAQSKQDEAYKSAQEQLSSKDKEIANLNAKLTAFTKGVNQDAIEDVIKLTSGAENIEEAIDNLLKKYPHFGQAPAQETPKPSFGTPQYNEPKAMSEMDKFLSAFGVKKK